LNQENAAAKCGIAAKATHLPQFTGTQAISSFFMVNAALRRRAAAVNLFSQFGGAAFSISTPPLRRPFCMHINEI
jgi:hypothetical protein